MIDESAAFGGGIALAALMSLGTFILGVFVGLDETDEAARLCDSYGAFIDDGHKYECRRIEEKPS